MNYRNSKLMNYRNSQRSLWIVETVKDETDLEVDTYGYDINVMRPVEV